MFKALFDFKLLNIAFLSLQDDENAKLCAKIKEIEEDRARLQKTASIQQTQIEKHRALAAESAKKCDGLQLQVSALHKVSEHLPKSNYVLITNCKM